MTFEEYEQDGEFHMEKAIVQAISEGATKTPEIVDAAHDKILKTLYRDVHPFEIRLNLLKLLQREDFIKKESATEYALTENGREFLTSPNSANELAANYVRNLIDQVRRGGKV